MVLQPNVWFSRICRAVVSGSCDVQDACSEQIEARSAIHGSLDGLDAVHLALDGARGLGNRSRMACTAA